MPNEPEIIPPDYSEVTPYKDTERSVSANPFSRFVDGFRRKNVSERRLLVAEFRGLVNELEGLNRDVESHNKSLVRLRHLDTILLFEERKVLNELNHNEKIFLQGVKLNEMKLLLEITETELKLEDAKQKLDRRKNPPEQKPKTDRKAEAINDALAGGGYYKQQVKAAEEALIKERGGREKFTDIEDERIRNAYRVAAEADESRG